MDASTALAGLTPNVSHATITSDTMNINAPSNRSDKIPRVPAADATIVVMINWYIIINGFISDGITNLGIIPPRVDVDVAEVREERRGVEVVGELLLELDVGVDGIEIDRSVTPESERAWRVPFL